MPLLGLSTLTLAPSPNLSIWDALIGTDVVNVIYLLADPPPCKLLFVMLIGEPIAGSTNALTIFSGSASI